MICKRTFVRIKKNFNNFESFAVLKSISAFICNIFAGSNLNAIDLQK